MDTTGRLKLFLGGSGQTITSSSSGSVQTWTSSDLVSQYTSNNNQIPNVKIRAEGETDSPTETISTNIYDIQLLIKVALDQSGDPEGSKNYLDDLDFMYVGANGLTESWSGSNGEISYGHEAHRDMLVRFAGYTTTAPQNWSDLDTDRSTSNWEMRWWELAPVEIQKLLEQIQYEFGFIFKFRPDGTGSYIYIKQTSELSASQTLNKNDISDIKISNTKFSELLTQMEINYEVHPAEDKHFSNVTSSNSTARTNWNIQTKENISTVDLDMNVGTPSTTPNADPNNDFYSYYDNIFGDIKKIVSCTIINPAKGFGMETGDIIQFSNTAGDMHIEPFGEDWTDYYMITELTRSVGGVKIKAREVG